MYKRQEYNGWLSPSIVEDFSAYAEKCFELFGHHVKTWTTFNEPLTFVGGGYGTGVMAPGRCSDRTRCADGDSETEPLLAAHHVLLSCACCAKVPGTLFNGLLHRHGELRLDGLAFTGRLCR